jgi:nitrogen fixation/metabolism regulation signal transduction histidine kinase
MKRPRRLSLRTKLALIFVGLAVIPCLTLTLLVSRQLSGAIEFWSNPGLQRSFSSTVSVARESMRVLEIHLARTVESAALTETPERTDLDLWRIYERRDGGYVLEAAEASDTGLIVESSLIEAAVAEGPGHIVRLSAGWLVAVAPLDSLAGRVLLGGYRVSDEFAEQVETARQGARHIGQLGLYKSVYKGWVWISALVISMVIIGGSILLARRLARGFTRPIEDLVAAMAQLGRGGTPTEVEPPADREMATLVRSFNVMAVELERSRRELQRAERFKAWLDVARRVAHEIKNPLTPIQFAIHRMKKKLSADDCEPAQVTESLDSILGEVETLRAIADSFSQLAKLPEPELKPLEIAALLREVVDLYQQPGIELVTDIGDQLPMMLGDRRQLRQVFNNLVQNGVEAMNGDGRLTVQARVDDLAGEIVIDVMNSSGRIDEENLERIWEPYFTTKSTGTGLGLAVVNKIIRDHGGRIELDNLPRGGVRARVGLPVADVDTVAAADSADLVSR